MGVTAPPLPAYVPTPWGLVRTNSVMRYVLAIPHGKRAILTHRTMDRGRALRALQGAWGAAAVIDRRSGRIVGSKGLSGYRPAAVVPPHSCV